MVGGSGNLVGLRRSLECLGFKVSSTTNSDVLVAEGAALLATSEAGEGDKIILEELVSHSIGIQA